jgi:solute carrier family 25 (mitochondrial carnitine/acylcarnitine transporter), member 20/29
MSITLVRTTSFSVYQRTKYAVDDIIFKTTGSSPLVVANTAGAYPNWSTLLCSGVSGAVAGAAVVPIACPAELTKNAQQLAKVIANQPHTPGIDKDIVSSYQKKGTFATALQLVKHRGLLGLYSGVSYHLLRDTTGTASYFMTYESVKQILSTAWGENQTSPTSVALAGTACGLVSWAFVCRISHRTYEIPGLTGNPRSFQ